MGQGEILEYLEGLRTVEAKYKAALSESSPTFSPRVANFAELADSLRGALMCGCQSSQPLTIHGDLGFVYAYLCNFAESFQLKDSHLAGGLIGENSTFRKTLFVHNSVLSGRGLDLDRVGTTESLVVMKTRCSKVLLSTRSSVNGVFFGPGTLIEGVADFSGTTFHGAFQIDGATFAGPTRFHASKFLGSIVLSGDFAACPEFFEAELPANTRLDGMTLAKRRLGNGDPGRVNDAAWPLTIDHEVHVIRDLRAKVQAKRWIQEDIALFAEEQRAARHALSWSTNPIERAISAFYDVTSRYGSSPSRPISLFLLWNGLFLALFPLLLILFELELPTLIPGYFVGLSPASIQIDRSPVDTSTIVLIPISNAFGPISLFPGKSSILIHSYWAIALSLVQSVVSLSLAALFFLALRSRFQRSSATAGSP